MERNGMEEANRNRDAWTPLACSRNEGIQASQEIQGEIINQDPHSKHVEGKKQNRKKAKKKRPDHFFALRMSQNPSVIDAIEQVQMSLKNHSPHLEPSFVDPITAHITLGVIQLSNDDSKKLAIQALEQAVTDTFISKPCSENGLNSVELQTEDKLSSTSQNHAKDPLLLKIKGLGHFRNSTLFLKAEDCDGLQLAYDLAVNIQKRLEDIAPNVLLHDPSSLSSQIHKKEKEFTPHITIAKLSKMQTWPRAHKKFDKRKSHTQGSEIEPECTEHQVMIIEEVDIKLESTNKSPYYQQIETMQTIETLQISSRSGKMDSEMVNLEEDFGSAAGDDLKVPKASKRSRAKKLKIPEEAYSSLKDIEVGPVEVTKVELCRMGGRKRGMYYETLCSIPLDIELPHERRSG